MGRNANYAAVPTVLCDQVTDAPDPPQIANITSKILSQLKLKLRNIASFSLQAPRQRQRNTQIRTHADAHGARQRENVCVCVRVCVSASET